jgi:hypothetical protein
MFKYVLIALMALGSVSRADDRSEAAAAELLHRRLQNENPTDAAMLASVHGKDIVVVAGSMDHIEQVLNAARIPYTMIQPDKVASYQFRANMIAMVDCPGIMPAEGVQRLEKFVRAGGLLYTTDWALKNVVEKGFPGTIAHNGGTTGSEVVPVKIDQESGNLMSRMLLRKSSQPEWWLEGGSFPIKVLDKQRVEILAHSDEMKSRYGAAPIVVRFKWEDGEVIHVVSHFYRQMATNGPQVAAATGVGGFDGLTDQDKREFAKSEAAKGAKVGDVESSYAFQRMTSNIVTGKQKRNEELSKMYNYTVKAPEPIRATSAPAAAPVAAEKPGTRMRILDRKDDQVRVRDEMGNEGWVKQSDLNAL